MKDILVRIKRAVLAGHYVFSEKARGEMEADGLTEMDVAESILNAVAIYKRLRSRSPSSAYQGVLIRDSKCQFGRTCHLLQRETGSREGYGDVLFSCFF